ncbi:unnamed protein product, partial [Vitis vinifera]
MWRVGVHSIGHVDSNSRSQALKPPKSLSSHSHHTLPLHYLNEELNNHHYEGEGHINIASI